MKFTVKRMVALFLALLLAVPSFAFAEEPEISSAPVDEIVGTTDAEIGGSDDPGLTADYSPVGEEVPAPAGDENIPSTDIDMPAEDVDVPAADADIPAEDDAVSTGDAGAPTEGDGAPAESDVPAADAGIPVEGEGEPAGDAAPAADAGVPAEGEGAPVEDAGASDENADAPAEGEGVTDENADASDENADASAEGEGATDENAGASDENAGAPAEGEGATAEDAEAAKKLEYVIKGDAGVALNEIMEAVGLSGEVTAVEVSNPELILASDETGEWIISALAAFDTEEWLKVTIDEQAYEITLKYAEVTDGADEASGEAEEEVFAAFLEGDGEEDVAIEALEADPVELYEAGGIAIDEVNFPDSVFRQYVLDHIDGNGGEMDGFLSESEQNAVTSISLYETDEDGSWRWDDDTLQYVSLAVSNLTGIAYFPNLESLDCENCGLISLDISQNTKLSQLSCYGNSISILDITNCASLASLVKEENRYSSFYNGNPTVRYSTRGSNDGEGEICYDALTALKIGETLIEPRAIVLSEANFPDEGFRNFLSELLDGQDGYESDGLLSEHEIIQLEGTELAIWSNGEPINSLQGIELFTGLGSLYVDWLPELTSLDLSKNTKLTDLTVNACGVTSIDLSQNKELRCLNLTSSDITSLDLSNNTQLESLQVDYCDITSLDLSNNTNLERLSCAGCGLTELDISNCPLICEYVKPEYYHVADYDDTVVQYGEAFTEQIGDYTYTWVDSRLTCDANVTITGGDPMPAEQWPDAIPINEENFPDANFRAFLSERWDNNEDNMLSYKETNSRYNMSVGKWVWNEDIDDDVWVTYGVKDLTGIALFQNIVELDIDGNEVTSLDLSKNTKLEGLWADNNKLTTLNVSGLPNLDHVYAKNNQLTSLKANNCPALELLDCRGNQLTTLEVSNDDKLGHLFADTNSLTSIDITTCPVLVASLSGEILVAKEDCIVSCQAPEAGTGDDFDAANTYLTCDIGVQIVGADIDTSPKTYPIVIDVKGSGSVTPSKMEAIAGDGITLLVQPDEGSVLDDLTVTGPSGEIPVATDNTFTMPAGNVTVSATFKKVPNYTAPTAEKLTYNGAAQALVKAGKTDGGSIEYSLDGNVWSADIPTGKLAGDYSVYYRVAGDDTYCGAVGLDPIPVTIAKKKVNVTLKEDTMSKGYGQDDPALTIEAVEGLCEGDTWSGELYRAAGEEVGAYEIMTDKLVLTNNDSYDVYFNGRFVINPIEIGLAWSNTELPYNGYEQRPTATVTGLKASDTCTVTVTTESGDGLNAGKYTATAANLSNGNYTLPEVRTQEFTIVQAAHDDVVVEDAVIVSAAGITDAKVDLSKYLADATSWTVEVADGDPLISAAAFDKDGDAYTPVLTYSAKDVTNEEEVDGLEGAVTVKVSSVNYADYLLTVNFKPSDVFTLHFVTNGGVPEANIKLAAGAPYANLLPVRTRKGYKPVEWCTDAALTTKVPADAAMGDADTTVYAKWTPEDWTISLSSSDDNAIVIPDGYGPEGVTVADGTLTFNIEIQEFYLPTLADTTTATFSGWRLDGSEDTLAEIAINPAELTFPADSNNTLSYKAVWMAGEKKGEVEIETSEDNGLKKVIDDKLVDDLKTVAGDESEADDVQNVVTAKMEISTKSVENDSKKAIEEEIETKVSADVVMRTDYLEITINKITTDKNDDTQEVKPTETVTETERVLEIPLQFDLSGRYNPIIYRNHGGKVEQLDRLSTRPKVGQRADGTYYIEGTGVDAIIYVYSQRFSTFAVSTDNTPSWQVMFESKGGSAVKTQTIRQNENNNQKVEEPEAPTRDSVDGVAYVFQTWCTDEACTTPYNFKDTVDRDRTLFAKWEARATVEIKVNGYTGTFDGKAHAVTVEGLNDYVKVYFSTEKALNADNYKDGATTPPSRTEEGTTTAYWYAHSEKPEYVPNPKSGSVSITINPAPKAESKDDTTTTTATTAPAPAPATTTPAVVINPIPVYKKNVKKTISAAPGSLYLIELNGMTGKSFKSSKKKVATVDQTGLVTINAAGKTKITFKVGKKKRTLTLTVKDPTVPNRVTVSVIAGATTGKKGETVMLSATLPAGTTSGIKWKSSNKKVATVDQNGVVTFKKPGKATITATASRGKKKSAIKVKVTK